MKLSLFLLLIFLAIPQADAAGISMLSPAGIVERTKEVGVLNIVDRERLDRIRRAPTTRSAQAIAINQQTFGSSVVTFNLPNGTVLTLRKDREERHANGAITWVGKIDSGGRATFTSSGSEFFGTIQIPGHRYTIQALHSTYQILQEIEPKGFPPEHSASAPTGAVEPRPSGPRGETGHKTEAPAVSATASATSPPELNILVAFTPSALQYLGSFASAANAVVNLNDSFIFSGINLRARLVGTVKFSKEYSSTTEALSAARKSNSLISDRNAADADIVVLVGSFRDNCGEATQILATAETAFAVVSADCFINKKTFQHEIGHLLGVRHNRAEDGDLTPYSFGHGYQLYLYVDKALQYCLHDIMAYSQNCAGDYRDNSWSNYRKPYAQYSNEKGLVNVYLGDVYSDASRVLDITGAKATVFRQTKLRGDYLSVLSALFAAMVVFDQ